MGLFKTLPIAHMQLTIFSRLVIGFIVIFLLQLTVSLYMTLQLSRLEDVPASILTIDNQIVSYEKKLTAILMSQMRYEKKYIITKDEKLYDSFFESSREFDQYLNELLSLVQSDQLVENLLIELERSYNQYQSLVGEEIKYLKAAQRYSPDEYRRKKDAAVDSIVEKLRTVGSHTEQTMYERIEKLAAAGAQTRQVALILTVASLMLGIVISVLVTRGIIKPLSAVKQKTQKIAGGDFAGELTLSSPPEIKDLAHTINWMCYNLKQIEKIKADFFSSMSHELRTPLTSIKEGINLLLERAGKDPGNKQQRLLAIMAEESNRLIELINSFLDLSKMEAGMMRYTFFPEDITPLIYKAINGMEPLAEAKNITIEAQVNNDLPVVKMDSERILQVLRNLIGNAVKFTNSGGHVWLSARPLSSGVEVSVSDTGEGIAEEDLNHIFDKFQQGHNVDNSNNIGTGLGLSIVKHIIEAHGGRVWAESKQGAGSTFIFVLSS